MGSIATAGQSRASAATRFPAWIIIVAPSLRASRSAFGIIRGSGSESCRSCTSGGRGRTTSGGVGSVARRKPGGRVSVIRGSVVRLNHHGVPRSGEDEFPAGAVYSPRRRLGDRRGLGGPHIRQVL